MHIVGLQMKAGFEHYTIQNMPLGSNTSNRHYLYRGAVGNVWCYTVQQCSV